MKCITRNDNGFEITDYEKDRPAGWVFEYPQYNEQPYGYRYHLVENNINVFWTNGTYQKHYISFKYESIEFKSIYSPTLQVVMEQLNYFISKSEDEIQQLAERAANNKIKVLKGEIAAIKESKKLLRKECNDLVTLLELGKELSTVIKNFDENRGEDLQKMIDLFKK